MIKNLLASPRLYWLFRIGWLERIVFHSIRRLSSIRPGREKVIDLALFGFDFSKWQGVIDFAKVFAYGAKFLVLRASYGLVRDERFVEYMQTASQLFIGKLSVYGYYYPQFDPVAQANKLLETINPYRQYIRRVWGDFEFAETGSFSASTYWKRYAETIIAAGYPFGVYTRKTWWDSRIGNLAAWFGQFPLWAAQYASWLTLIPAGWTKADLWQKGTPVWGAQVGTQSLEVDLDVADNEFYDSEYGGVIEPPPGGGSMQVIKGTVITQSINIRKTPGGDTFSPARYIVKDDIIEASEHVAQWLHLTKINSASVTDTEWASAGSSQQYISWHWEDVPVEPPPPPPPPDEATTTINMTLKADGTVTGTWTET